MLLYRYARQIDKAGVALRHMGKNIPKQGENVKQGT